jgi:hypothetical protein
MTEPHQFGSDPYGGQQAGGAPQYGGQQHAGGAPQYGAPQQYGPPTQPGPPAPPYAPTAQPPKRNMRRRRIIALVVLVLIVGGVGLAAWSSSKSSPDAAKVGDCVSKTGENSVEKIGCGDGSAAYKVVGKVEHKTQVDLSLNSASICSPFPTSQTAYWRGEAGKEGYVLCLAPLK